MPGSRLRILGALLAPAVAALAACGSTSTTTTTTASGQVQVSCHVTLARTKFVLHTGIAVGAFHRYVIKPYRAGAFKQGAPGRKKALLKAGASALLAYHELKVAAHDANCDGPALKKLAHPLVGGTLGAVVAQVGDRDRESRRHRRRRGPARHRDRESVGRTVSK